MRVCVFGSSSNKTPEKYLKCGRELGLLIASSGDLCVNGGGAFGCMGAVNQGAREGNGQILGVIHDKFTVEEEDKRVNNMIVSSGDTLSERKQMLVDNCDCIIVLPGGVGTLDELWETTCNRSLHMGGMDRIPICVLNVDGYFDGCVAQLQRAYKDGLLYMQCEDYFHVETTAKDAMMWCEAAVNAINEGENAMPVKQRWAKRSKARTALDFSSFLGGALVGCLVTALTLGIQYSRRN